MLFSCFLFTGSFCRIVCLLSKNKKIIKIQYFEIKLPIGMLIAQLGKKWLVNRSVYIVPNLNNEGGKSWLHVRNVKITFPWRIKRKKATA